MCTHVHTVCSLRGHMPSVWTGVPELSLLSECSLSGIAGCEMLFFPHLTASKIFLVPWKTSALKEGKWSLAFYHLFSLVSVSLSSCTHLFYMDTHRNITYAYRHKHTDTCTHNMMHTHTCRRHTHMLTNTMYTHRYHTPTSHARSQTSRLSTYA